MPERRVFQVERTDFLVSVRPGHGRGTWVWFDLADVPELRSGENGWYEIGAHPRRPPRGRKWRMIGPASCPILPGGPS